MSATSSPTDHGIKPRNAAYVYEVFPNIDAKQMPPKPNMEILANTSDAQAVRSDALGLTAVAFWKPGSVGGIEVDEPCLILAHQQQGKTAVTLSNPENRPLTVNVNIGGKSTKVQLPAGEKAGSSITVNLP
jgi:hypothetical protein